mmetsp:Transcript_79818/g.229104  ORF Transcript_79818/g.229104 Transcript_79818/m.229104 type:complete len:83 (+) Transcript_79818:844-1092(+)
MGVMGQQAGRLAGDASMLGPAALTAREAPAPDVAPSLSDNSVSVNERTRFDWLSGVLMSLKKVCLTTKLTSGAKPMAAPIQM